MIIIFSDFFICIGPKNPYTVNSKLYKALIIHLYELTKISTISRYLFYLCLDNNISLRITIYYHIINMILLQSQP